MNLNTIKLIRELTIEIDEIDAEIKKIMNNIASPITTIPCIGYSMRAMIISKIGDFRRFSFQNKVLAYAVLSPSTYQSGKLDNCYSHMAKHGSQYLRYALFNVTKYVCHWDNMFAEYLFKKRTECKHYYIAISHAVKKLIKVIFYLEKTGGCFFKSYVK